ncbi:hypothetical protein SAMN05444406_14316 [Caldicoprobacter faecalis]|uniref:Uncharacterized protein n=1 Tax=Caldicoprobacter faecalis TaxID=937334 RepID=A0A1I5YEA6_9FIRM|nr:hypothetical protein SAMN05444406_14316 [Caldicoprobacter faecalis]
MDKNTIKSEQLISIYKRIKHSIVNNALLRLDIEKENYFLVKRLKLIGLCFSSFTTLRYKWYTC